MPYELKDLDIRFISLVKAGANGRTILWKSAELGEDPPTCVREIAFRKTDEEKHMVYGIVYAPNDIDSQGDFATAEEIEAGSQRFMKGLHLKNVDRQHDYDPKQAFVAESWIIRKDDPLFPDEVVGAWAVGIKIEDDALWNEIKKGEIQGISMAGSARKVMHPEEKGDTGEALGFFMKFLKSLGVNFERGAKEMNKEEVGKMIQDAIAPLKESLEKAQGAPSAEDLAKTIKTALDETMKPVVDRLDALEKQTPGSRQGEGNVQPTEDPVELGKRIAKMIS